ncbi:MAG TPA: extracellular solute-binding protein, partial [Thermoplasmatales archaeon]|nr:extracellular solute-binding protein [Thermoplasmatales archaeon]
YRILMKNDVRFGFSNPNKDPCGYRTMMVIQLAEIYYKNGSIFDELIEKNTPIKCEEEGENYTIYVPDSMQLSSNDRVMLRDMEVDLMAALETGEIDYLFIYGSVATQHAPSGVKFVELPPEIDLSGIAYKDLYTRVKIVLHDGRVIKAKPIVYGVTIPSNAEHPDMAVEFLKMLLGEEGQKILEDNGQIPITPAICKNKDLLPPSLKPYVE